MGLMAVLAFTGVLLWLAMMSAYLPLTGRSFGAPELDSASGAQAAPKPTP